MFTLVVGRDRTKFRKGLLNNCRAMLPILISFSPGSLISGIKVLKVSYPLLELKRKCIFPFTVKMRKFSKKPVSFCKDSRNLLFIENFAQVISTFTFARNFRYTITVNEKNKYSFSLKTWLDLLFIWSLHLHKTTKRCKVNK